MNKKMHLALLSAVASFWGCNNSQSTSPSALVPDTLNTTYHIIYSRNVDSAVFVDISGTPVVLQNYHGAQDTLLQQWAWADTLTDSTTIAQTSVVSIDSAYRDSSLLDSTGKPITGDSVFILLDTIRDTSLVYDSIYLPIPQTLLLAAQNKYTVSIENKDNLHIYLDTIYAGRSRNHEVLAHVLPGDSLMFTFVNAPSYIQPSYYNYCEDAPDTSYIPAQSIRYHVNKLSTCNYNQAVVRYEIRDPSIDTTFQWSLILASRWGTTDTMNFTTTVVPVFGY